MHAPRRSKRRGLQDEPRQHGFFGIARYTQGTPCMPRILADKRNFASSTTATSPRSTEIGWTMVDGRG